MLPQYHEIKKPHTLDIFPKTFECRLQIDLVNKLNNSLWKCPLALPPQSMQTHSKVVYISFTVSGNYTVDRCTWVLSLGIVVICAQWVAHKSGVICPSSRPILSPLLDDLYIKLLCCETLGFGGPLPFVRLIIPTQLLFPIRYALTKLRLAVLLN